MMKLTKTIAMGLVLVAGVAFAQATRTDPNSIARGQTMGAIGGAMKVLGDMAGGAVPHDAAAAEAAKAALVAAATSIPVVFEPNTTDDASKAKPDVWTNWDDFAAKAKVLSDAATALDVNSVESIGAGMGALGGACKDCHTTYRM
jgi:cytochrome c556